ncbi:copper chaperone PCu(A)C [Cognatilysobacter bugurensis]|uniref:Uncharacterized protein n=1 Tax=Cognatilysobacter bugurensis TaxID=543356 RepID=A0A918W518_9GAMM|nr:hypothetical protein GCM10007067_06720 [Lysobacter bugurensis]
MTLRNEGNAQDRLLPARSPPRAADVQLHDVRREGSVSRMRLMSDTLVVPSGATMTMSPVACT